MLEYLSTDRCRMQFLRDQLDDPGGRAVRSLRQLRRADVGRLHLRRRPGRGVGTAGPARGGRGAAEDVADRPGLDGPRPQGQDRGRRRGGPRGRAPHRPRPRPGAARAVPRGHRGRPRPRRPGQGRGRGARRLEAVGHRDRRRRVGHPSDAGAGPGGRTVPLPPGAGRRHLRDRGRLRAARTWRGELRPAGGRGQPPVRVAPGRRRTAARRCRRAARRRPGPHRLDPDPGRPGPASGRGGRRSTRWSSRPRAERTSAPPHRVSRRATRPSQARSESTLLDLAPIPDLASSVRAASVHDDRRARRPPRR